MFLRVNLFLLQWGCLLKHTYSLRLRQKTPVESFTSVFKQTTH